LSEVLARYADYLITILTMAIFGQVIMSWISPRGSDPVSKVLFQITEPILGPLRRVIPPMGMFDLSPMIALLVLNIVGRQLVRTLAGG
jgi:YggT family protein